MEAGLSDEQEASVLEPGEHPASQAADLIVAEVHEEPVGKDDVVLVGRQFQLGHIRSDKVHMSVVPIPLLVPVHVIRHKVHGREMFHVIGQVSRKSPE